MAQRVLAENAGVESVRYELPNKHYIPVDMKYIGVDNTTPCVFILLGNSILVDLETIPFVENVISLVFVEQKMIWRSSFLDRCPLPVIADLLRRENGQLTHPPPDETQRSSPQWTRQGERQRGAATGANEIAHTDVIDSGLISATISRAMTYGDDTRGLGE